ncbi:8444_t:CDS:2 [Paraglomus occultum]|uniref:8444_t:CDS:1 n=1 Tax=Paraglomus occultum TaxID=144539 RepID=A0A9N8VYE6_9GLOM|nr:8444_t:CDS:2 [Paraglomus occultum]
MTSESTDDLEYPPPSPQSSRRRRSDMIYDVEDYLNEIESLDGKRRAILSEIDNADFGWFHIRTCIVSGVGFFTDAYDLFVINFVTAMLGYVYYQESKHIPTHLELGLKMSAAIGTFIGQLFFGWLADHLGRKRMYGLELMIMIVATVGSCLSANAFAANICGSLIFWRIILGLGIGGDYPMSAVITAEFATKARRGAMIAAVFAMQGFGILTAGVISVVVLSIYKENIYSDIRYIDYCWRIIIGFGAVPAAIALYFRLTIPETPRFTIDIERNVIQAADDVANIMKGKYRQKDDEVRELPFNPEVPKHSWKDFKAHFGKWENAKVLLGTSISWFMLDVAFYGVGLNNSIILDAIGFAASNDPFVSLWNISVGNIIITMIGTVPGYWFTVFFVDSLGRKFIQSMGFAVLTVLFVILGFAYKSIVSTSTALFITLFALAQFFQNFGPNSTTFIVPGEAFPTRYRSTCHGISAASGKLGAIISQVGFLQMKDIGGYNEFVDKVLLIFSLFTFLGFLVTFWIPETSKMSLEELSNEQQEGFIRGPIRSERKIRFEDNGTGVMEMASSSTGRTFDTEVKENNWGIAY